MNKQEYANECAMVSAIIADHIAKRLYKKMDQTYLATVELIAKWAAEFVKKHKDTDWEDALFNDTIKPLSKEWGKQMSLACWDDAVIDFAYHKLETYN